MTDRRDELRSLHKFDLATDSPDLPHWHARSRKPPKLLVIAALGYIFHGIEKRLGAWGTVNPSIEHIVPSDVGVKIVRFGLLLELSFQFSQLLRVLFG